MTTQITIRNKQADNLLIYIEKYKAKFEERLVAYNAVGQLEWNAGSWRFGEKGVAWLKETKDRGFKWDEVSSRIKGLSQMNISSEFGSDSNLLIVLYVQIMPDDLVMQLHRF